MQLKQFQEITNKIVEATHELIANTRTDKIVKLEAIE